MANALYDKGREGFLAGDIDWDGSNIKAILVDEGTDTPDLALDEDLADRTAGARIATSANMSTKTVTAGVADCADFTWSAVSGASCESVDFYVDTTVEATSRLICNIDTATGLPVTPNGGDITFQVDSGANKLFKL